MHICQVGSYCIRFYWSYNSICISLQYSAIIIRMLFSVFFQFKMTRMVIQSHDWSREHVVPNISVWCIRVLTPFITLANILLCYCLPKNWNHFRTACFLLYFIYLFFIGNFVFQLAIKLPSHSSPCLCLHTSVSTSCSS